MRPGWFLQSFCVQQARCERTMHAEMVLEVLQMMYGISAAFECNLRLFARILGAEVGRFRSKIARFCVWESAKTAGANSANNECVFIFIF